MLRLPITTDPVGFRWFIKHDILLGKSVFEGFKDMCKIDPGFEYPEYEFWYYRFLGGNHDMSYNRSADPKPRKLEELPVEVLEKILEPVDVKTRFKIREVSQTMLHVVDQLKTNYDEITIDGCKNSYRVYVKAGNSSWETKWSQESAGGDSMEITLRYLEFIMKPTTIRVEHFDISGHSSNQLKRIVDLLVSISKTKNAKFHVKSAEIGLANNDYDHALSLLSVMKPKILETLIIGCCCWEDDLIDMTQIKEMEQFKQAKSVNLRPLALIQPTELALFSNFENFVVGVQAMGPEDVKRLRDDLSNNSTFKMCTIALNTNSSENIAEIAKVLGKEVPDGWNSDVKHSCPIPNSEKVLNFLIQNDEFDYIIEVEKDNPNPPDNMYDYEEDFEDESEEDSDDDSEFDG